MGWLMIDWNGLEGIRMNKSSYTHTASLVVFSVQVDTILPSFMDNLNI